MGSSLIQGRTFGLPRSTKRRETNVRKKWRMLFSRYFTPAGFHRLRREWCGFNFVWEIASFAYHRGCLLLTSSLFPFFLSGKLQQGMEHDLGFQIDKCYHHINGRWRSCWHPLLCGTCSSNFVCAACCKELNDNKYNNEHLWSYELNHSGKNSQKNNCLYKKHGSDATVCIDCQNDSNFVAAGYSYDDGNNDY